MATNIQNRDIINTPALFRQTSNFPIYNNLNDNSNILILKLTFYISFKFAIMKERKSTASKLTPSQLVKQQITGNGFFEEALQKPRIIEFLNLADYSINTESYVNIDEPLFEAVPPVIQFSDYEPLQIKQKVFKLRNKDRFSRRVKIIQPDSKLFQVLIPNDTKTKIQSGTKVAAGMETKFVIRFSPEAKIDYKYELIVVTERQKFIVPIVAVGKRAMIDFPDILDFGACPVKYSTQKPVIIRNLGEKTTKWNLQLPNGFTTNQKQGVLQPGKNQQILIKFYPTEAKLFRTTAKLQYDKLQAYVQLTGSGQLSNVYLSKPMVSMEQSYIGLQSQQTLHIINKSNVKVNFEWRSFPSQKQEKPKKQLLYHQLQEQEAEQLMLLREVINSQQQRDEDLQDINDSSSQEQVDPRQYLDRKRKRAELALTRKYKTIKKAIEDDLFLFQDSIFKIEPLVGEIWPNSQITITVTFMPLFSKIYECTAYCNVSCAEQRLPLKLKGQGLGPKAYLTQQQINFGDIFVNQPIRQTVQIQNRGQIPCHFTLEKPERAFAKMFNFSVDQKTLEVGQNCSIQINFKSSIPGEFKEKFKWKLHDGSLRNLEMTFLGHVIAPTFEFVDPNDTLKAKPEINFGKVSYDFDYKQYITLKNTSSVEFNFSLKIQSESKILQNQFRIHPQSGTISEKSQKVIEIQFTPKSVKKYETVMTIDIQGVGNDMLSVPIKADCQVPVVDITPAEKVQFAQACLNYPETKSIILNNHSDIKAKFYIVPQSQQCKVLAKYTVTPESGVIDQKSSKQLQITLITSKLSEISLPLHINIIGTNNNQPHLLNISAYSDGPKVAVTPQQIDFGQVEVLRDYYQKVTIVNNSKIKAEFHAFTRQKISIFKPKIKHAFLEPGERLQFDVVCNADDSSKFNDILHFVVKDGKQKDVILKAKGIGSTIYCDQNLQSLNFGTIYTFKTAVKQIFIQNRGRKPQKISWQRRKIVEKKKNKEEKQPEEQTVFSIDPETETIPPKYGRYFRFIAMSQKKGKIVQQFNLLSQVGNQRKANQLKTMAIQGQFTQPNLIYSEKKLNFKYVWQVSDKDIKVLPLQKTLQLTSGSSLPLDFTLKVSPPFSVSEEVHFLEPGAKTKIKVEFDPNYKVDKVSGILNGKINVVFADHPYKQAVQLLGQVCFPNLKLEASLINFGAILNDTTKKISMLMKNVSEMAVTYEWAFLQEQILGEEQKMNISSTSQFISGSIPINEVFDILPLSGKLDPGQVQEVEFIYNAQGGILYRTTALCHVEGGPNYEVKLQGDSSLISGKISEKQLDFGVLKFCQWSSKDIYIENTGKVTFEFKVSVSDVKRKPFLQISPMNGKILGGQKHKITIKICPTMPQIFTQQFEIQMGYYDPEKIVIKGQGVYPSLTCQFPRSENPEFDTKLKQEVDKYAKEFESYHRKISKDKSKKKEKEMKSIEQYRHQIEKEMDRKQYCKLINQAIQSYLKPDKPPTNNIQTKLFEKIYLTNWICDFGNVIVGSTQRKQLKFKNVGDQQIEMLFDLKPIKNSQYNITPDKSKLGPGEEVNVVVTLATKKNSKFGKLKSSVMLEVKNGAKYKVDLISNLTIPEIVVEGVVEGVLDFGKVLCGQRKIITLRFLNLKQIPCEWSLNLKQPVSIGPGDKDKDNEIKYELNPSSGRIPSGGFQMVKVLFTPSQQKEYINKFPIKIQQNPKILNLQLKGLGTCIILDVKQPKLKIGPVLPYDQKAYALLEISNPSIYPTQLINLDFDRKFKQDIETLSIYEEIKNGGNQKQKRVVFLPTREAGAGLWPEVITAVNKKNKADQLKKKLDSTADQSQKVAIQKEIDSLNTVQVEVEYPRKVDSDKVLHLILTGPSQSGKTHIATTISQIHKRAVIKFDEIIEWVLSSGSELGGKIQKYLEQRRKEFQSATQEREKAFKKAGKKAKQLQQKLGPSNQAMYDYLPENIWVQAIKERMKHPECGAGCVFDNLKSKHLPNNQILIIKLIMIAAGNEAVQVIDLDGIVKQTGNQPNEDAKSEIKKSQTSEFQNLTSKGFTAINTVNEIDKQEQQQIKFEVKDFVSEEDRKKYQQKRSNILKFVKNQFEGPLNIPIFRDPIFEDQKKEPEDEHKNSSHLGNRDTIHFPIHQNSLQQRSAAKKLIPAPLYNDPMKEPLPEPEYQQVITKHSGKFFQSNLLKQFQVFTPKDKYTIYKKPEKKEQKKDKRGDKKSKINKSEAEPEGNNPLQVIPEGLSKEQTRWVIPPQTTLKLYVKFFTKAQGNFQSIVTFENTFNLKKTQVPLSAKTEFSTLSNAPKTLFWNLKKSRPSTVPQSYLSKVFVLGENCFDFGPLLIGKNAQKKKQKQVMSVNSTTFKLVNIGHYPAEVQIALLSTIMQNQAGYKKGVFSLQFDKCTIQPNDPPKQLRVWSIPDEPKPFIDELIIMIKNNPTPITVPLKCLGSKPVIQIKDGSPIKFTRILLHQAIKRELKLQNTSAIPIKFRLQGCQKLPSQFNLLVKEGKLKPNETISIDVGFKALKQQKFTESLKLIAEDTENLSILSQPIDIPIEAEAFDISVDLKFPNENTQNLLDYGAIKVGDFKDQNFTVKNIGLYMVKISFTIKKKLYKDCFRIEPMSFDLDPNSSKEVLVRFSSLKQVKLKTNNNTTDIFMEILEGKTSQTHRSVPINVSVNSVFSNYSIVPLKNMNFGPIQFNESKSRIFEIKNEGLFQFNFSIFDNANEQFRKELLQNIQKERDAKLEAANTLPIPGGAADKKGAKKQTKEVKKDAKKGGKGGKGEPQNSLKIGQWTITPASGTVSPDSNMTVEVKFTGNGQKLFEQKIAVDIENRNPNDQPNGILYELVAQSCIPGINTQNFQSIFEEQLVLPSQQHSTNVTSLVKSNVFFVQQRIFNFGTLVPSKVPQGIIEKIKIENSNKVTCTVKFDVRKKTPNAIEQFAFEVEPKQIKIPPHEYHYVKIIFKPTIMASYAGLFEAIVQNGDQQPKTHKLTFDLKGEGALPTLRVQKPKQFLDERTILLKFPKTRVGKSNSQQISLKNDGSIPATVKFDLTPNDSFKFLDNATVSLNPKTYSFFNIEFKPTQMGVKNWDIVANTLLNQFETMRFKIQGQAYFEDLIFENLPLQEEDKINFDDCVIGEQKRITFSLRNNGQSTIKFNWAFNEDFKFIPGIGHLAPKSFKSITVVFKSNKTISHKQVPIPCETVQIKQNSEEFIDWDDSMIIKRYVTKTEHDWIIKKKEQERKKKEEQAQAAKKGGKKDPKKAAKKEEKKEEDQKPPQPKQGEQADIMVEEVIKQPENAVVQKSEKSLSLKATAVADYAKYEINSRRIDFLPTMMYTSRVHKFSIKNTSTTKMSYNCKIVSAQTGKIDSGYFIVSPHSGTVNPGCDENFTVKFSPTEVEQINDRLLVVNIKNLDPSLEKLIVQLNGQTQRPICHFEIAPSKYRQKKPDIEAKYNIIEFQSLGTKVKNTKRFYVVNPTSLAYDYEWKKTDDKKDSNSGFFRCSTPKGTILSGKKAQMIFQYTPDLLGTHESYWTFEISSQKITQYFYMIGDVVEPNIFFDTGKINFGPLLLGGKNRETISLKNLQQVPLAFDFNKQTIRGDLDSGSSLRVEPMSGVVPSGGQAKIEVTFEPKVSKQFNYNIACNVTRKSRPICINVKGIGYVLSHSVHVSDRPNLLNKNEKTEISFGNIFVNETKTKTLSIENNGDFNFDFAIKSNNPYQFLNISKQFGTVKKNQKFNIDLEFAPTDQFAFKSNAYLTLAIISGPTYTFQLRGTAKKPGVDFSFFNYDFGSCFVLKQPLSITAYLEIRNRQNTAMTIQSLFEKTDYLDVKIPSGEVVLPLQIQSVKNKKGVLEKVEKNVLRIPIVFTPRQLIKYNQTLTFDINSLNKIHIKIKGEGIPLKLEVEKTQDQNVDFGITRVGQDDTRVIGIVNNSKKKIQITFNVDQQLEELKKMFININMLPTQTVIINPREKYDLELSFKPNMRIPPFKTQLLYKIVDNQEKRKLLNIFTTAHGIQMKLMEDTVGFGTVVTNSKITKTIQLSNFGDIPSKFEWDTKFCNKYFTITPEKGHLNAHEDILFDVTFHPNVVDNDIKFRVKCSVEGMDPLFVNLIGKCIPQPNQTIQQIKFDCMVRKEAIQKITLKNPTAKIWKIKASISSNQKYNYFKGNQFVEVPANGQTQYEVKYIPLTMTANQQQPNIKQTAHNASLFFPIPDGTALMYKLVGKATPPNVLQTFDLTTKAKKNLVHLIPIKNWLTIPQRFNVTWKFDVEDKTVFINAANTFDVAGDTSKDYKLSIYALKACNAKFNIFFKNSTTHQFVSFRINLTVTPSDPMQVIELSSLVRQTTHKLITLQNPLPHPIQIKKEMMIVESDVVFLSPNAFSIPAKSEFGVEIIFRPLLAKEENTKISIKSPDLGEFVYPLKLIGLPSTSDRVMSFKAALGGEITQKFKFIHYGKKPTTYTCRVQKLGQKSQAPVDPKAKAPVVVSDFVVQTPTVNVQGTQSFEGVESSVNIKFEPSSMGESVSQLIISSLDGGQYIATLNGVTTAPQPKGPYKISAKPPPIDFKNPFFEAYEFTVRIDNPSFTSTLKSPVKVDGKKVLSINLAYKAVQGFSANGRLTISAGENLTWVFYLQGE